MTGPESTGIRARRIAGIVLAAGRSSRMAPRNKLLLDFGGGPVVRRVAAAALESRLAPVLVVTGHAREAVTGALHGLPLLFAHNAGHAEGIASSLRTGIAALPERVDAVVILLGDMPFVEARHVRALLAAFSPESGSSVCVPTFRGTRGNPVLWGAAHLAELRELRGDGGARRLFAQHAAQLHEVAMPDAAVLLDVDDSAAYDRLGSRWPGQPEPEPRARLARDAIALLYDPEIFRLARRRSARPLGGSEGVLGATLTNRLCGDRVRVEVASDGAAIRAYAYEARGCLLCEAAAAAFAEALPGKAHAALGDAESYLHGLASRVAAGPPPAWSALRAFAPLREHPGRLGCVLLPLQAVQHALGRRGEATWNGGARCPTRSR